MWGALLAVAFVAAAAPPSSIADDPLWPLVGYEPPTFEDLRAQHATQRCEIGVGQHCLVGRGVVLHVLDDGPELSLNYVCTDEWREYVVDARPVAPLPGGLTCRMDADDVAARWGAGELRPYPYGTYVRYVVDGTSLDLYFGPEDDPVRTLSRVFVHFEAPPVVYPDRHADLRTWLDHPLVQLVGLRDDAPEVQAWRDRLPHRGGPGLPFTSPTIRYAVFSNGVALGVEDVRGWFFRGTLAYAPDAPTDHPEPLLPPIGWQLGEDVRDLAFARARVRGREPTGAVMGPQLVTRGQGRMAPYVILKFGRPVDPTTGRPSRPPRLVGIDLFTGSVDGRLVEATEPLPPEAPPPRQTPAPGPTGPSVTELLRGVAQQSLAGRGMRIVKEGPFQATYVGDLVLGTWLNPGEQMALFVFAPIAESGRFSIWHPDPSKPTGYWDTSQWVAPQGSAVAFVSASYVNTTGVTGEHAFRVKYGSYTGPLYYVLVKP